jgi:alpha-D-ribose 1-methylphosphonate 5-triphosphate synthase subunit PhnH
MAPPPPDPPPAEPPAADPPPTDPPAVAGRARLDSDASQRVFRVLLDALSRPAQSCELPTGLAAGVPRALLPALALADVDVPVAVIDEAARAPGWLDVVRTATGARAAHLPSAQIVVALRPPTAVEVAALETGSPEAPERGARLVIGCRALVAAQPDAAPDEGPGAAHDAPHDAPHAAPHDASHLASLDPTHRADGVAPAAAGVGSAPVVRMIVRGPGVPGERACWVAGIEADVIATLDRINRGYPAGIDTWLVSDFGTVVGLPRSSTLVTPGGA